MEQLVQTAQSLMTEYGLKVIGAIVILIVGRIAARIVSNLVKRVLTKASADPIIISFASNVVYVAALAFVAIAVLGQFGVQTASFIAVIGAAGLAVGLALQGSLANFAAGVLMILFRPFRVGDFIEAAGTAGVVEEIMIFSTKLKTGDNRQIIIPNSNIMGGNITNFSAKDTRRIDLVVGCGYNDDLRKVREVIEQVLAADDRVLQDPAPTIGVLELGDSSVNFAVRPWVKTSNYWGTLLDLNEQIKLQFDEHGLSIPYPQQDVHMHQVA